MSFGAAVSGARTIQRDGRVVTGLQRTEKEAGSAGGKKYQGGWLSLEQRPSRTYPPPPQLPPSRLKSQEVCAPSPPPTRHQGDSITFRDTMSASPGLISGS